MNTYTTKIEVEQKILTEQVIRLSEFTLLRGRKVSQKIIV